MLSWLRRIGPAAAFGRFCALLMGIALTWTCAGFGLLIVNAGTCRLDGRVTAAKRRISNVEQAVGQYLIENDRCPKTMDVLVAEKYLPKQGLVDPWGTRIAVFCAGEDLQVTSAGRDRTFGTADDIKSDEL
jgi:hypothetical protein